MNTFTATVESEAVVTASGEQIWHVLTDPVLLPQLTPLLTRIDADGTTWTWHMAEIRALGVAVAPAFTEAMTFTPMSRIEFTHRPPAGRTERAGAEGWYQLDAVEGGTRLRISLTLCVALPLPRAAKSAVTTVMRRTMTVTGDRFSRNLLRQLDARQLDAPPR